MYAHSMSWSRLPNTRLVDPAARTRRRITSSVKTTRSPVIATSFTPPLSSNVSRLSSSERVNTRTFRIDTLLKQHGHINFRVINHCALTRFVGFEVPKGCPHAFNCLNQLSLIFNVGHGGVQPG